VSVRLFVTSRSRAHNSRLQSRAYMCPLSVALFERFTVCSAKMDEPIDGKASNRLRYTLSVVVVAGFVVYFVSV